jgi:hypothetical protein
MVWAVMDVCPVMGETSRSMCEVRIAQQAVLPQTT